MLRYILRHEVEGDITLTKSDCPANVDNFTLTLSRSEIYADVLRTYTIADKFYGKGKAYIDSIYKKYGWQAKILVDVEEFDQSVFRWNKIIENGRISWAKIKQTEIYTEVNIEDGDLQAKIMNRHDIDINIFSTLSVDGATLEGIEDLSTPVQLRGLDGNTGIKAIYPKNLFRRIINSLSGEEDRFDSTLFDTYPQDGELATIMFCNGKQIRNLDETNFSISLKDAFEALSANRCLGMGFETIDGKTKAIIDKRNYFYTPIVSVTLEEITDLEYSVASEFMFSQIKAGYANFEKKENQYGQSEYNNKATYSTPLTDFKKTFNIISPVRADGVTIEELRTKGVSDESTNFDNEIFLLDCVRDSDGNLKSRQLEGLNTNPSGISGELQLYTNLLLSPARMVYNWKEWLSIGLQFDKENYLRIQKNETLTNLKTFKTGDEQSIQDGADIPINDLGSPFLSGEIVKFNAKFSGSDTILIRNSPRNLIRYKDYILKQYKFAYVKELQITPVENTHQFEGYVAILPEDFDSNFYLLDEQGLPIMNESGGFIILEKNMLASSKISQLPNLANIPDDAFYLVAYNGSNYNQTGAQLKAGLAFDIEGAQTAILPADSENAIILGSYDKTTYIVNYQLKRGTRFRSGIFTIVADEDNQPAIIAESGTVVKPNNFEETAGVLTIAADVSSTQVRLIITTDDSDSEQSELTYLVTVL